MPKSPFSQPWLILVLMSATSCGAALPSAGSSSHTCPVNVAT